MHPFLVYLLPILHNLYVFLASTYFYARCLIALKFLQLIIKEGTVHPKISHIASFSKFYKSWTNQTMPGFFFSPVVPMTEYNDFGQKSNQCWAPKSINHKAQLMLVKLQIPHHMETIIFGEKLSNLLNDSKTYIQLKEF